MLICTATTIKYLAGVFLGVRCSNFTRTHTQNVSIVRSKPLAHNMLYVCCYPFVHDWPARRWSTLWRKGPVIKFSGYYMLRFCARAIIIARTPALFIKLKKRYCKLEAPWNRWYPAKGALPAMLTQADRALLAGYPRNPPDVCCVGQLLSDSGTLSDYGKVSEKFLITRSWGSLTSLLVKGLEPRPWCHVWKRSTTR